MKVKLDAKGMLTITAENGTELYALNVWHKNLSPNHSAPGMPLSSIRVAPFISPGNSMPLPEVGNG